MANRPSDLIFTDRFGYRVVDGNLEVWAQSLDTYEWYRLDPGTHGLRQFEGLVELEEGQLSTDEIPDPTKVAAFLVGMGAFLGSGGLFYLFDRHHAIIVLGHNPDPATLDVLQPEDNVVYWTAKRYNPLFGVESSAPTLFMTSGTHKVQPKVFVPGTVTHIVADGDLDDDDEYAMEFGEHAIFTTTIPSTVVFKSNFLQYDTHYRVINRGSSTVSIDATIDGVAGPHEMVAGDVWDLTWIEGSDYSPSMELVTDGFSPAA